MRITYDREVDALMVHLGDPDRFHRSQRLESGAVLDLAEDGTILSIEIQGASRRYGEEAVAGLGGEEEPPISLAEAAQLSGIGAQALQKACQEGRLAGKKIGRNWTTTAAAVATYKAGRKHEGPGSLGKTAG